MFEDDPKVTEIHYVKPGRKSYWETTRKDYHITIPYGHSYGERGYRSVWDDDESGN